MKFRNNCPLCNSKNFDIEQKITIKDNKLLSYLSSQYKSIQELLNNEYKYELRLCCNCGTRYQSYFLDQYETEKFYGENIVVKESFLKQVKKYESEKKARIITANFLHNLTGFDKKKKINVLEVGAGWGFFAELISSRNFTVTTLEIEKNRRNFHSLLGLKTVTSFEDALKKQLSFDLIYSNQVLEHLPNLKDTFDFCSKLLNKGGYFVAEYPSFNNIIHYLNFKKSFFKDKRTKAIEHLQLISDKGVKEFFKKEKSFKLINKYPFRHKGDRIKILLQNLTPVRSRGRGFLVVKKIK